MGDLNTRHRAHMRERNFKNFNEVSKISRNFREILPLSQRNNERNFAPFPAKYGPTPNSQLPPPPRRRPFTDTRFSPSRPNVKPRTPRAANSGLEEICAYSSDHSSDSGFTPSTHGQEPGTQAPRGGIGPSPSTRAQAWSAEQRLTPPSFFLLPTPCSELQ